MKARFKPLPEITFRTVTLHEPLDRALEFHEKLASKMRIMDCGYADPPVLKDDAYVICVWSRDHDVSRRAIRQADVKDYNHLII